MAVNAPFYSKAHNLPSYAKSNSTPMCGDPDNCDCCGRDPTIYRLTPCVEAHPNDPCATNCPEGAPRFLTVVTSHGGQCGCIDPSHPRIAPVLINNASISSTFILTNNGSGCTWTNPDVGSVDLDYYGQDPDCSDDPTLECGTATLSASLRIGSDGDGGLEAELTIAAGNFYCSFTQAAYIYKETKSVDDCWDWPKTFNARASCDTDPRWFSNLYYAWNNATATIYAGDNEDTSTPCPGGSPIYTDTDLSAYVGKVVLLEEGDQDVCYTVEIAGSESDGPVTVNSSYLVCNDEEDGCCDAN